MSDFADLEFAEIEVGPVLAAQLRRVCSAHQLYSSAEKSRRGTDPIKNMYQ